MIDSYPKLAVNRGFKIFLLIYSFYLLIFIGSIEIDQFFLCIFSLILILLLFHLVSKARSLTLTVFTIIPYACFILTIPIFCSYPEDYKLQIHRPLYFTFTELVEPTVGIFLYLVLTGIFFIFVKSLIFGGRKGIKYNHCDNKSLVIINITIFPLVLVVLILLSLKILMYNLGVGIGGVIPPRLPFKLTGILIYIGNYFLPLIVGFLAITTKSSKFWTAFIVLICSLTVGVLSSSKGTALIVGFPILCQFLYNSKYIQSLIYTPILIFSVFMASQSRQFIHSVSGDISFKVENYSAFELTEDLSQKIENFNIFSSIYALLGRVESIETLWLSISVNSFCLGGDYLIFINKIYSGLGGGIHHSLLHLEYLGYEVPIGHMNAAGTLGSGVLMTYKSNKGYLVLFGLLSAITILFMEYVLSYIFLVFDFKIDLLYFFNTLFGIFFYIAAGSAEFSKLMIVLIITIIVLKSKYPYYGFNRLT